ncbi:MAG: GDP-mannose 4,6-dehydratase [Nitrososphaera sp.]
MSLKKVIVTGGAGFIGSHLVRLLSSKGYNVIVYDNFSNGSGRKNLPKNVRIIKGDILDFSKMKSYFKNSKMIFNLAVLPLPMSFYTPDELVKVNDYGSYLVAKVCTELKTKLIHVSSSEAYGTAMYSTMKENHPLIPTTIYASSKAASELYVKSFEQSYGLEFVIVRPFNAYGEFMRQDAYAAAIPKFYSRISKRKNPIIYGTGNQTRDLTYVQDTANGIFLAAEEPRAIGETFNIAQGKETKIKDLATIMIKKYAEITGKELKLNLEFKRERRGDVKRHMGDISFARKILGYKPEIDLEEGIGRYIRWRFSSQKKKID